MYQRKYQDRKVALTKTSVIIFLSSANIEQSDMMKVKMKVVLHQIFKACKIPYDRFCEKYSIASASLFYGGKVKPIVVDSVTFASQVSKQAYNN